MKEDISTQFPSFSSEYVVFVNAVVMSYSTLHRRLLQVLSVKGISWHTGMKYIPGQERKTDRLHGAVHLRGGRNRITNNVFISTAQSPTQDIVKDDPSKQSI